MEEKEILEKFQAIVSNRLGYDESEVILSADLSKDLGMDSLDEIEILMDVEAEFNISISDELTEEVKTVQQAVDLIAQLIK